MCLTASTLSLPPQGKLSLHNDCDGTEHVFSLRGVGEHPLPVGHLVLHCPVGQTTHTQLDVPNYSERKLTLKVKAHMQKLPHTLLLVNKVYLDVHSHIHSLTQHIHKKKHSLNHWTHKTEMGMKREKLRQLGVELLPPARQGRTTTTEPPTHNVLIKQEAEFK